MKQNEIRVINAYYRVKQEMKPVRIVIRKNDEVAIAWAQRRMHREASKNQHNPASPETALMNECMVLATSLDFTAEQIVELYRARWQIEMVFLRLKELFGMEVIPNKKDESIMVKPAIFLAS